MVPHFTPGERAARGKAARAEIPRSTQGDIAFPKRRDPVALLEEQAVSRVPELVPIRYGRMLVSPFAFYRGGALIMAADLANTPNSGLRVQLCGDAHLSNFGMFGSPERDLVFDINDFDETAPGPWEWDVKRLAASFAIGGRENGFSGKERRTVVLDTVRAYREAMAAFAGMRNLEVWYAALPVERALREFTAGIDPKRLKKQEADIAKVRTKDSMDAFEKLTHLVDGEPRIISDPPLIVPIDELIPTEAERDAFETEIRGLIRGYRRTLETDRRHLIEEFRYADMARKVVGVGSVGTRAWILLFLGKDDQDPLFLQVKEAQQSVLEQFAGKSAYIELRPAGRRRPAADAGDQRHLPRLATRRRRPGRSTAGLLRAPTQRLEGLVRLRSSHPAGRSRVRESVRLDARARPRPLRRPDRDLQLPRQIRRLRPGDRDFRRNLRRPERARLQGTPGRRRLRPCQSPNRSLKGQLEPHRTVGHRAFVVTTAPTASSVAAKASGVVLLTLAAGQFVMALDMTVMNTAIATVAKDVGTDVTGIQTAITLYTLVMASLMITGGRVGEIIGRKRAFTIGCVVYACGSLTTALSHSLTVLIIGWSFLEGFGAVLIMPAIVALVASNFGRSDRPRAYGLVAAAGAMAAAVGPVIGGLFTTYASWRWVFVGEVLIVIVILVPGAAGERHTAREGRQARPGRHRAVGGRPRAGRDRHPALGCVGVRAAEAGCSRVARALAGDLARARGRCGAGPVRRCGRTGVSHTARLR